VLRRRTISTNSSRRIVDLILARILAELQLFGLRRIVIDANKEANDPPRLDRSMNRNQFIFRFPGTERRMTNSSFPDADFSRVADKAGIILDGLVQQRRQVVDQIVRQASVIPSFFEIKEVGGVRTLSEKNRIVGF